MKRVGIIVSAIVFAAIPGISMAHTTGASWNATSSPYVLDVGYDPVTITTSEAERFDFLLWKGQVNTGEAVDYDHVWVRIIHDKRTLLATGIRHQKFGPTTMLYEFRDPGEYAIETSFRDEDGNNIATASFPFTVSSEEPRVPWWAWLIGAGGVLVLVGTFYTGRLSTRKI